MPVNYGVLRGSIIDAIPYQSGADHYQIEVQADELYRIAVDVYSQIAGGHKHYSPNGNNQLDTNREVMFYQVENFTHPILSELLNFKPGFTGKVNMPAALCLDYLSINPPLFPLDEMKVVAPKSNTGPGDDLNDDIDPVVQKAKKNPNAEVFAFGSGWDDNAPGAKPDPQIYFKPNPSLGIHDIHMNQGDTGFEAKYNGRNQDGALFFYFKDTATWTAMFFKFQNQSTDNDSNGNPV
jgi:uncharacterized protein YukJ